MNVAVFGTRNEDNLNRIYRLCAFFGVETLVVVGSRARVRGNLFSAKDQVAIEYLKAEEDFWNRGFTPIIAGVVTGGILPHSLPAYMHRAVICVGSENAPVPRNIREKAHEKWTIPQLGKAPPLTADQALAIFLHAAHQGGELMPEKSNKQREISRREAMRVARDKLDSLYRRSSASGYIAIDVQSGKAIWVKTFLCKVKAEGWVDAHDVFADLERELIRFEAENLSGRVHLIVYRGRPVQVESVVEDDKVRVG